MKLCAQDNIIWSHRSSKRCLFVFPAHSYSFSTQALELHDYESWMRPGETRELCWSMKKTHYYCGTFRCSNVVNLPIQDVAELGLTEKNIVKRSKTYGVFDQLNTVLSKADLLRDLHLDGTLLVRCHALEYVDWNNRVSDMFARFGDHADAPAVKSKKKKKNGPSKKSKQQ
ncbi:uncharacterized protein C8Q71DRAFT_400266 [Rhodofomes roseus]|uniref:Uncharacterized protein n=1 Tax=Rhodofomes roseus TaxID=34475 RepID=A0ABQ8JZ15_9APHY|nr:uncharacterized protein C8Q71DRAFT_400266 [Rhodofomes roseus]KAH9829542.1 hypothetical protein C8Q71DRAFT_400266 [Rhodofomes roseus]